MRFYLARVTPALAGTEDSSEGNEDEYREEAEETEAQPSAPIRSRRPRRYTTPKFLNELDLASGDAPFKDFCTERSPKNDAEKYLLIASWLKKHRNLDTISTDHIYTCYQAMGWKSQKDVGQPFRNLKKDKNYFESTGKNEWKITHIGLDAANAIGISSL